MNLGTKTVLLGFHQFLIHPFFVAAGWRKLYGFPWDPRLWIVFFVHDLGYLGKPNIDGPEGESHPELGAKIIRIFGREWSDLILLHSRFYAHKLDRPISRLCYADKKAICLTPRWLWKFQIKLTGEWREYVTAPKYVDNMPEWAISPDLDGKYRAMVDYLENWLAENFYASHK